MAYKGLNLFDEYTVRSLYFIVPLGRRGTTQMAPADVSKTSNIAKVKILVEQLIRRMKTFHLLPNELSISVLSSIDNLLTFGSALCNFKSLHVCFIRKFFIRK